LASRPACRKFGATLIPKNLVNQAAQPPIHGIPMKPRVPVLFEIDVRHGDGKREHLKVGHSSERLADGKRYLPCCSRPKSALLVLDL
jgi:hypothetical protein